MEASQEREISAVMQRLSSTKQFEQLHTLLNAIYQSQALENYAAAQATKDPVKLILLGLVDEVWAQPPPKPARQSPPPRASKRHTMSQASLRSSGSSMQSLQARSYEELYSMSEFAHISSPGTFRKAKLETKSECKPGPGDYDCDALTVRKKSPSVVIAKASKRFDYIPKSGSPGPGQYYPMRHFVSK